LKRHAIVGPKETGTMHIFDLNHLFKKHGLVMVWEPTSYHGFRPEDIDGDRIKDGACPIASFGSFTYVSLSKEKADEFIVMSKRVQNHYRYLPSSPYIVSPIEQQGLVKSITERA
jgi:hypothetical protein